jgi:hypothetical protein
MVSSDEDRGRSRRPSAEDHGWSDTSQILDGRTIKRSGDTVCSLHHARGDDEREFFWLSLKTKVDSLSMVWPQNHWDGFSRFDLKIGGGTGFLVWASKPVTVIW